MLQLFKKVFDKTGELLSPEEKVDRNKKLEIATCVILLEAATADSEFSEEELQKIIDILRDRFQMTESSVNELIETSKREREDHPGLWHFTSLINDSLSRDEKYELMEMIWQIIYSDKRLDTFENHVAHNLRRLLHIDHSKFIELKLKVKNSA